MTVDETECLGLRARKKLATRQALSQAALGLALERGLDNVRVDDIAAAAGVSPRTYNNYFPSREAAICALAVDRAQRVAAALADRPADEPLGDAIVAAMSEQYVEPAGPQRRVVRLIMTSPGLRGEFLKTVAAIETPLVAAIAARTGSDPERDLFPGVLAAAVYSAARVATERWLRPDCDSSFGELLSAGLRALMPAAEAYEGRLR